MNSTVQLKRKPVMTEDISKVPFEISRRWHVLITGIIANKIRGCPEAHVVRRTESSQIKRMSSINKIQNKQENFVAISFETYLT